MEFKVLGAGMEGEDAMRFGRKTIYFEMLHFQ